MMEKMELKLDWSGVVKEKGGEKGGSQNIHTFSLVIDD